MCYERLGVIHLPSTPPTPPAKKLLRAESAVQQKKRSEKLDVCCASIHIRTRLSYLWFHRDDDDEKSALRPTFLGSDDGAPVTPGGMSQWKRPRPAQASIPCFAT